MVESIDLRKKKLMSIVIMVIIMILTLILMITTFTLEYMFGSRRGDSSLIINIDGDGKPDLNIDTNCDGIPDTNIDTNGDGVADKNIKYDKDIDVEGCKIFNADINGDGKSDINIDRDGNGKADLNVDTNGDGYPDINIDTNGDGKPDVNIDTDINLPDTNPQVDALVTMMLPESVDLYVKAEDLSKANVGNLNYVSINSEEEVAQISLKSNADTTNCKYNVIFNTEYNYFENKYKLTNGTLGTLNNQLILHLDGYDMNDQDKKAVSHTFDLIDIKNKDAILLENVVISDEFDNKTTNIEWKIRLSFRNYRDYDQVNNAGKSAKGNLIFKMIECERTK